MRRPECPEGTHLQVRATHASAGMFPRYFCTDNAFIEKANMNNSNEHSTAVITNGDVNATLLHEHIGGVMIFPWRENHLVGPITSYKFSKNSSNVSTANEDRAHFMASLDWGSYTSILAQLEMQSNLLSSPLHTEITLMFERDLYDFLQISQVISLLQVSPLFPPPRISICISDTPLHSKTNTELEDLYETRTELSDSDTQMYASFWEEFTSPHAMSLSHLQLGNVQSARTGWTEIDRQLKYFARLVEGGFTEFEKHVIASIQECSLNADATLVDSFRAFQKLSAYGHKIPDTTYLNCAQRLANQPESITLYPISTKLSAFNLPPLSSLKVDRSRHYFGSHLVEELNLTGEI